MAGLQGLQGFIGQKHPSQPFQRRQVSHDLRIPVPPTRLELQSSASLSTSAKSSQQNPFAHQGRKPESFRHQSPLVEASNGHHDGFDTDAEGLDDTIVTSTVSSIEDRQNAPVIDRPELPKTNRRVSTHDTFGSASVSTDHEFEADSENNADNQATEEDGESYEESGDEDDSEEEDGADQDDMPNNANLLNQLNDPDFIRFCQQSEPLNKNTEYQKLLESPSTRSIALRSTAKLNATRGDPIPTFSQPGGFTRKGTGQQLPGDNLPRAATVSNLGASLKSPQSETRHLNRTVSYQSPRLVQHMVNTKHNELERSASPALQKPIQNRDAYLNTTRNMENVPGAHLQMLMPPPPLPNIAVQAKQFDHPVGQDELPQPSLDAFAAIDDDIDEDLSFTEKERMDEDHVTTAGSNSNKRSRELDHSPNELSGMTYAQLRSEPFNVAPQPLDPALPEQIDKGTLAERLAYLAQIKDEHTKKRQWDAFLSSLSMEEYEQCGEHMVLKFTQIVSQLMDTRQQKRKMLTDFEDEIGEREHRVRGKAEAYQKHFSKLKRGGEDVVKQKMDL